MAITKRERGRRYEGKEVHFSPFMLILGGERNKATLLDELMLQPQLKGRRRRHSAN